MERFEAANLAQRLMREQGLDAWAFRFNRQKRTMGLCRYHEKLIELSLHFVDRNDEAAVRDTILHEIAHALAGARAGHGPAWKKICVRLGAVPRACGRADMPEGRYRATCPECGRQYSRHRRVPPRHANDYYCGRCGPKRGALRFVDVKATTSTTPVSAPDTAYITQPADYPPEAAPASTATTTKQSAAKPIVSAPTQATLFDL